MVFPIPHELMGYCLLSTCVALTEGEALSKLGLNEILASLVLSLDYIMCEVHLYDLKVLNISRVVFKMYLSVAPKLKALSCAPSTVPKIKASFGPLKIEFFNFLNLYLYFRFCTLN